MNPIKPTIKSEFFPIFLILLTAVLSFYFYNHFPMQVPTHWNFEGQVNGYGSRASAAFAVPVVIFAIYLLFLFLPYLDPKKERYAEFRSVYHSFKNIFVLFFFVLYIFTGLSALGVDLEIGKLIPVLIGLFFIYIGSLLREIKPNWFFGIRTPWTLSSENVWEKTHIFGSKIFMVAGLLIAISAVVTESLRVVVFLIAVALMVLGTLGYSYYAYYQEKKNK